MPTLQDLIGVISNTYSLTKTGVALNVKPDLLLRDLVTNLNLSDAKALARNLMPAAVKKAGVEIQIGKIIKLVGVQGMKDGHTIQQTVKTMIVMGTDRSIGAEYDSDNIYLNEQSETLKSLRTTQDRTTALETEKRYQIQRNEIKQTEFHPTGEIKLIFELLSWNPSSRKEESFIPNNDDWHKTLKYKQDIALPELSNKGVYFWATLKNLSEPLSPNQDTTDLFGRTEQLIRTNSVSRTLSLNFSLNAFNKKEQEIMIKNMNFLTQCCYPGYVIGFLGRQTPLVRITIGDLYKRQLCIIQSFDKTYPTEIPWINEENYELPVTVDVSLNLNLLHSYENEKGILITEQPTYNSIFHTFATTGV